MPSLKVLRKRITSVRNTQQITKAMKMVSAAKLRRAQEAAVAARPYAAKLTELLTSVAGTLSAEAHPLLRRVAEPARVHLVVITSDRGLCGAYNSGLLRRAEAWLRENGGRQPSVTIVGRKGADFLRRRSAPVSDRHVQVAPTVGLARELAAKLTARFTAGEVDRIDVLFSAFRSALSQTPTVETLLPVATEALGEGGGRPDYVFEPDAASLLDRLLPQYVEVRLFRALLEAAASEHGARMTAMDSATRNASEMIFTLTLQMNRARQAAITRELMEIISGAEALKG
jgi:F-type H+-transporting ATPase subunit gamma